MNPCDETKDFLSTFIKAVVTVEYGSLYKSWEKAHHSVLIGGINRSGFVVSASAGLTDRISVLLFLPSTLNSASGRVGVQRATVGGSDCSSFRFVPRDAQHSSVA